MIIQKNTPMYKLIVMSKCGKCGKCCRFDSGYLVERDIRKIAKYLGISEEELKKEYLVESEKFNTKAFKLKLVKAKEAENIEIKGKKSKKQAKIEAAEKPYGRCVFLDNNECSIHDAKPIHCQIGNPCQEHGEAVSIWFTLNYFVNEKDPESVRQWALYLKTHPTIPGGTLPELVPDQEKLSKILSYEILTEKDMENYEKEKKK